MINNNFYNGNSRLDYINIEFKLTVKILTIEMTINLNLKCKIWPLAKKEKKK